MKFKNTSPIKRLFRPNHREHRHPILILGTSGVGKTTFIYSLVHQRYLLETHETIATEVWDSEIDKIGPLMIHDVPGAQQQAYRHQKKSLIASQITDGTPLGLINVVSYGYKEFSFDPWRTDPGLRLETFLAEERQNEIFELQEWLPLVEEAIINRQAWFLTLINKADLWWEDRREVMKHYEEGSYYEALGQVKGYASFVEYASIIKRFYGGGTIAGTFDDIVRSRLYNNVVNRINEAIMSVNRDG